MRVLVDECLSSRLGRALREQGHDVVLASEVARGFRDEDLLALAHREGRVLVTFDKGFGELVVGQGRPHAGLVRLSQIRPRVQVALLPELLARFREPLGRGAVLTVRGSRVTVRDPASPESRGIPTQEA